MTRGVCLLLMSGLWAGCSGAGTETGKPAPPAAAATGGPAETQTVALKVPTMHCPFACWPTVKKTLQAQGGVADVTLAPQADEQKIDNPTVYVKLNGPFDADQAITALAKAGFKDATVQ